MVVFVRCGLRDPCCPGVVDVMIATGIEYIWCGVLGIVAMLGPRSCARCSAVGYVGDLDHGWL